MKIIVVEPHIDSNKEAFSTLDKENESARIATLADTALLTHGKPVFVPDWGGECQAKACVALRISRLGKSIPSRFAPRYYDALSIAVKFELATLRAAMQKAGKPWHMAENFDGAVSCGNFADIKPDENKAENLEIRIKAGDNEMTEKITDIRDAANEAIAAASAYMSLRQGDIMLLPLHNTTFTAVPNTHVTGYANNEKLIEFNIK